MLRRVHEANASAVLREPRLGLRPGVDVEVVEDDVDIAHRILRDYAVEEREEILARPSLARRVDLPRRDVERCDHRRRPAALVLELSTNPSASVRVRRMQTPQRLNPSLLVDAEYVRPCGRLDVEGRDSLRALCKLRVRRMKPPDNSMWRESAAPKDRVDLRAANTHPGLRDNRLAQ